MGLVLEARIPVTVACFPNELLERILGFCSSASLFNVCLVDRRFSDNAYPLLYRTIPEMDDVRRITDLLTTIYLYDRPASLIRSLTLSLFRVKVQEPFGKTDIIRRLLKLGSRRRTISLGRVLKDMATLVSAALPKLTNLDHLLLFLSIANSMSRFTTILLGQCTFQLVTFSTTLAFDDEMAAFLRTQQRLRVFHIGFGDLASPFIGSGPRPGICTTLEIFGWTPLVSRELVAEFIENCPISAIHLDFDLGTDTESIANVLDVGPSSRKITYASFTYISVPTARNLDEIAFQFPNLKQLVLTLKEMTEEITRELTPAFRSFKNLEAITICMYGGPVNPVLDVALRLLFHQWFRECKTLRYLSLPHLGLGLAEKGWYNKMGPTVSRRLIEEC